MAGLFDQIEKKNREQAKPLAARMRPRDLSEFVGESHFLGPDKLLTRLLNVDRLSSLIFYGPPGTGKTSLAELIARKIGGKLLALNAASSGVKEVRALLSEAEATLSTSGNRSILFVDELHHFSKTQQDVLLPDVEQGTVIFIGATTDNPYFALVAPLLSRSQIFEFQSVEVDEIIDLLKRALADKERGLANEKVEVSDEAFEIIAANAEGDVRRALNSLEVAVLSMTDRPEADRVLTGELAQESIQRKVLRYDRAGDEHYDVASAFIKSIRGSDPDAAIYWMARMLEAGEPPRFVARRLMISAAEDIGNADPQALVIATAAAQSTEMIGWPECRIPLAQAATYLASAPKSNAAYAAINEALDDVRNEPLLPVPSHLKGTGYSGAAKLGRGVGYQNPHQQQDSEAFEQDYGVTKTYYRPTFAHEDQSSD